MLEGPIASQFSNIMGNSKMSMKTFFGHVIRAHQSWVIVMTTDFPFTVFYRVLTGKEES